MTASNQNPFVLPGMGQGPELSGNPLLASMEMMRHAWSSLAGAGGLAQSMPMTPPLNLEELERRIADLRTVENWLQMNLSLLSSTIQGLEVQRATIATLRSFADGMAAGAEASPLEVLLGIRPGQAGPGQAAGKKAAPEQAPAREPAQPPEPQAGRPGEPGSSEAGKSQDLPPPAAGMPDPVASASQAWWSLLQKQFDQIAAATAASMPASGGKQDAAGQPRAPGAGAASAKGTPAAGTSAAGAPAAASPAARGKAKPAAKRTAKPAAKRAAARKPAT
ncbi:PhaM family polyhydroxyalkanoate granule multifunctional regulatory protein [Orrella sp. JC864]|uniref:PhaM family polyhydroxyalkanoate granule multifunctional regulatory protein n=1 Tax=Orrella sp. JC864 TaxID=3120298 RepID=UPI0012BBD297